MDEEFAQQVRKENGIEPLTAQISTAMRGVEEIIAGDVSLLSAPEESAGQSQSIGATEVAAGEFSTK
ncbi:MAG TPA: hypothetical protein VF452_22135 [Candidatus Binatia bacterium]